VGLKETMFDLMMTRMDAKERQDMMGAMMEKFLSQMSAEERQGMMSAMMDRFMGTMSPEEKQSLMATMMPKMMGSMFGGGGSPMAGMMDMMMGRSGSSGHAGRGDEPARGESERPWDMCKTMMDTIGRSSDLATFATPEVRGLFEEWVTQIEEEILQAVQKADGADPAQLSQQFKLSEDSIHYFLSRLARQGKIHLKAEKTVVQ
jgi:hypothetical protein